MSSTPFSWTINPIYWSSFCLFTLERRHKRERKNRTSLSSSLFQINQKQSLRMKWSSPPAQMKAPSVCWGGGWWRPWCLESKCLFSLPPLLSWCLWGLSYMYKDLPEIQRITMYVCLSALFPGWTQIASICIAFHLARSQECQGCAWHQ